MSTIDKWSILAGVRFILASIVAIGHMADYTTLGYLDCISGLGSFEAILGFLLISGYSISMSYTKQPEGFLVRRIMRLYPIYLTAIAATCLSFYLLDVPLPHLITLVINGLFLNQLVTNTSFVGLSWSLSLEFWLYCLTPFLMGLSMSRTRLIVFASFACYLVYTILRTVSHMPSLQRCWVRGQPHFSFVHLGGRTSPGAFWGQIRLRCVMSASSLECI